ncbi:hypothetical protein MHBO_000391 [Bonamia ostreae]|uniref:Activator of basal transcription 1 n=1 Tax=Bonamia ostreae TaxID=126728 RepID=A0ABV2AFF9_9EUKA
MSIRKRKKFENGWIEFADKNVAKNVANSLNKTKMGGSVKNKYREDLWNLKFLPGFKWHHLTEQIQYEQEIKELKMREAAREAEAEEKFYLKRVSQNNFLNKMAEENKEIDKTKNRIVNRTFRQSKSFNKTQKRSSTNVQIGNLRKILMIL